MNIPAPAPREMGFLDVVGHTARENTISNVYRYFLDKQQSPVLSELLITSLKELMLAEYEKRNIQKELDLSDYSCHREHASNAGRIDLLIKSKECKIIIEFKIYHDLVNDLEDYWNSIEGHDHQKVGVVISLERLKKSEITSNHFINITHSQWLNHAFNKGFSYDLPIKDLIYFKDFVNNMNHLTTSTEMTPEVEFYLKHSAVVNNAVTTKESAFRFLFDQFNRVARHFEWDLNGNSHDWQHLWDGKAKSTVYYLYYPPEILNNVGTVRIIMEIYSKAREYENQLRDLVREEVQRNGLVNESQKPPGVIHLFSKTYHLDISEYNQLAEKMITAIENDLEPIRQKMLAFLREKNADSNG